MHEPNAFLPKLQAAIYLAEVAALSAVFVLAAATTPEFVLGPLARIVVAVAFPAPCHLLLVAHLALSRRTHRRRSVRPILLPRPQLEPIPA